MESQPSRSPVRKGHNPRMGGQVRYEVRATSTTSQGEGEEGLWLVTFTPVNEPSDRAFDPEWKDIQISVKPDAIKRLSREAVYTSAEIDALRDVT